VPRCAVRSASPTLCCDGEKSSQHPKLRTENYVTFRIPFIPPAA
jgi:hypothetical protein